MKKVGDGVGAIMLVGGLLGGIVSHDILGIEMAVVGLVLLLPSEKAHGHLAMGKTYIIRD
jgi:hypothetical protein